MSIKLTFRALALRHYIIIHIPDLGLKLLQIVGGNLTRSPIFVSALDPACKYFEATHLDARLDSGDAQCVDVIHTDSDDSGLEQPLGHLDFYPNGGEDQIGCQLFDGRNIF